MLSGKISEKKILTGNGKVNKHTDRLKDKKRDRQAERKKERQADRLKDELVSYALIDR